MAIGLLIGHDRLNLMFLILVGVLSAAYALAFVSLLVFHILQIPVMQALMWILVAFGFSWMVLDGLIDRRQHERIQVPSA